MATVPIPPFPAQPARELPDYMPARMVNEFVYCPRLFFYEWVEGLFQESADTGNSRRNAWKRGLSRFRATASA